MYYRGHSVYPYTVCSLYYIGSKQCTPTKGLLYYIGDKQCRGTLIGPYSIGGLDTNRVSIAYNINAPVYRRYTVWGYTVRLL